MAGEYNFSILAIPPVRVASLPENRDRGVINTVDATDTVDAIVDHLSPSGSLLTAYEIKVLELLTSTVLSPQQIEGLVRAGELVSYEATGSGYFLSIRHASLPRERIVVCHEPMVTGCADGVCCGFVVFIEDGVLTLECHVWGEVAMPTGLREQTLEILAI